DCFGGTNSRKIHVDLAARKATHSTVRQPLLRNDIAFGANRHAGQEFDLTELGPRPRSKRRVIAQMPAENVPPAVGIGEAPGLSSSDRRRGHRCLHSEYVAATAR